MKGYENFDNFLGDTIRKKNEQLQKRTDEASRTVLAGDTQDVACGYCGCKDPPEVEYEGEWPCCPQCKGV